MKKTKNLVSFTLPNREEWWNDKFKDIIDNKDRYLILIGGRGSGKSHAVASMIVIRLLYHNFFRGLAVRKNENDVRGSCHADILKVIKQLKLDAYFDYSETETGVLTISCKLNDNKIFFGGQGDVEKVKSKSELTFVWVEEAIPPSLVDFQIVNRSIRTTTADWIQTVFSINPTLDGDPEKHWFYNKFHYDKHDGLDFTHIESGEMDEKQVEIRTTSIHSNYRNNKFLSPEYKFDLENEKDPYLYQVDTLGKFSRREVGGRFYKLFTIANNITPNDISKRYDPKMPLFISFDFNTKPYLALLIAQIYGKQIHIIDEMALKSPNNYAKKAALSFIDRYKNHQDVIYVTGDANGHQKQVSQIDGHNTWKQIFDELYKSFGNVRIKDRTKLTNPSVSMRGSFINTIFLEGFNGMNIWINKGNNYLIDDLLNGLEKEDGTKLKQTHKDKETGDTWEKWHHMTDCFVGDTMVSTINGEKRIDEIKIGDLVLTRKGYKKVLKTWDKGYKKVNTYNIGDIKITCTPNHKFYTKEDGFTPIDAIQQTTFLIYNKKTNIICEKKLSVIKESTGQDIQIRKEGQIEFIIQEVLKEKQKDYIDLYGMKSMVKYQKDIILTTLMEIRLIMTFQIWNASVLKNIYPNIIKQHLLNLKKKDWNILNLQLRHQKSGIEVKRVENGILNTLLKYYQYIKENVIVAENIMKDMEQCIVQRNVPVEYNQEGVEQEKRVYDIMVEDQHEFFANGILVHNCLDYMIINNFESDYKQFANPGNGDILMGPRVYENDW